MNIPGEVSVEKVQTRKAEVIGSLGVAGFLSGSISIFMSRKLASVAGAAMLMMEPDEQLADEELVDAIGELTNMIGGNIKGTFEGVSTLSLPCVHEVSSERSEQDGEFDECCVNVAGSPIVVRWQDHCPVAT